MAHCINGVSVINLMLTQTGSYGSGCFENPSVGLVSDLMTYVRRAGNLTCERGRAMWWI